jgi:hypothetical protein
MLMGSGKKTKPRGRRKSDSTKPAVALGVFF